MVGNRNSHSRPHHSQTHPTMNQSLDSTTHPIPGLGTVVLCGGKSSRLGMDKAQLQFQGETFLARIVRQAAAMTRPVVAAIGTDQTRKPALDNVICAADENQGIGPLEGIRVGLNQLASQVEFAFVCGCDTPLIQPSLISRLFELIGNHQAVVPIDGTRLFGTTAIYRTDMGPQIANLIANRQLRVMDLGKQFDTRYVELEALRDCDPELDSFININSRAEFVALLRRFGEPIPHAGWPQGEP